MFSQVGQIGGIYQFPPPIETLQWCKIPQPELNVSDTVLTQEEIDFDRLLPTLFECFVIVFCGFLSGRCNLISQADIRGLNDFTMYFSLTSLIFLNLVTINFSHVNWLFVLGILLGKICVFVLVAFVTAYIQRPLNLSYAGIYGIFCTQGNDFGLAYPVVSSLFGSKRPLYPGYMYLIAPTSLLFTNPMGFFLMETQKNKTSKENAILDGKKGNTFLKTLSSVSWSVIKNPVVFVTILGIIGNFLFHNGLPTVFYGILQILSSAFSAAVLFLLGFSVAGCEKSKSSSKEGLLIPAVLIIAKMLISPLITRGTVVLLCSGAPDVDDLADYGFLYGMVPTGPIVMLFAAEYCLRREMLASTMVLCTALFGPVMFILAKMFSLKVKGMEEFESELKTTMLVLSVLSTLACLWIGLCLILSKKWKHHIYKITLCLLFSQTIMTVGVFIWAVFESMNKWTAFFEVAFICSGQLMTRLWTALLALTMAVNRWNPFSPFVQSMAWTTTFGFGVPVAAIFMLLIMTILGKCEPDLEKALPLFIYGKSEAIAATVILLICLLITAFSLVWYYRSLGISTGSHSSTSSPVYGDIIKNNIKMPTNDELKSEKNLLNSAGLAIFKLTKSNSDLSDILSAKEKESKTKKLTERDSLKNCQPIKHSETAFSQEDFPVSKYSTKSDSVLSLDIHSIISESQITDSSTTSDSEDSVPKSRHLRHIIFLIISSISMAVGLTISTWKISATHFQGLFVAIEFLDVVLNVGQGLLFLVVFYEESKYILKPIGKWLSKSRRGIYSLNGKGELDDSVVQVCRQFRTYHWDNCMRDLPKSITMQLRNFNQCFTGKEFVDWLIDVGLSSRRADAELYGYKLLKGGVITNADDSTQFHDSHSNIYRLLPKGENF